MNVPTFWHFWLLSGFSLRLIAPLTLCVEGRLPLSGDEQILEIEYLPAELTPDQPLRKNSIVDVRCKDAAGRQFIVEMQMEWSRPCSTTVFRTDWKKGARPVA